MTPLHPDQPSEERVDSQSRRTARGIEPIWPAELWWCITCGEPCESDPCQFCGNGIERYKVVQA